MVLYPRHRTILYPKHMAYQKACKHKASIPSLHTKPRTSCPATHGPQAGKLYYMAHPGSSTLTSVLHGGKHEGRGLPHSGFCLPSSGNP